MAFLPKEIRHLQIVICDVINRLCAVSLFIKDKVAAMIFSLHTPPPPNFGRDVHIRLNYALTAGESKVTGFVGLRCSYWVTGFVSAHSDDH